MLLRFLLFPRTCSQVPPRCVFLFLLGSRSDLHLSCWSPSYFSAPHSEVRPQPPFKWDIGVYVGFTVGSQWGREFMLQPWTLPSLTEPRFPCHLGLFFYWLLFLHDQTFLLCCCPLSPPPSLMTCPPSSLDASFTLQILLTSHGANYHLVLLFSHRAFSQVTLPHIQQSTRYFLKQRPFSPLGEPRCQLLKWHFFFQPAT